MSGVFTWNLLADIRDMWSLAFMVNAFRAGTIVAVLAALVGWFMVLRKQSFAGHTLAIVGFPGAAGATLIGISAGYGYFGFCVIAALIIAALPRGQHAALGVESEITGTLLVFALLVMPAATAQVISARPSVSLALTVLIAVAVTWLGLGIAYF